MVPTCDSCPPTSSYTSTPSPLPPLNSCQHLYFETMSNQNVSNPASDAAAKHGVPQHQGEDAPHMTNVYVAPYHPHERNRVPGSYIVMFHPGHTIDKHFAFLGLEFEVLSAFEDWYGAELDDQLFNSIRRDPGVAFVEDNMLCRRD